jgi:predicted lipid-binding transport protein (Tim44 family)
MQTIDWGYATVDSTLARTAFSPVCTDCTRFMKIFDNARAKGVHFRGGRMTISKWLLQPNDHHNGATAVVDTTVSISALQATDRAGKVVESDPAHAHVLYRVWLRWTGTRWTVVDTKLGVEK